MRHATPIIYRRFGRWWKEERNRDREEEGGGCCLRSEQGGEGSAEREGKRRMKIAGTPSSRRFCALFGWHSLPCARRLRAPTCCTRTRWKVCTRAHIGDRFLTLYLSSTTEFGNLGGGSIRGDSSFFRDCRRKSKFSLLALLSVKKKKKKEKSLHFVIEIENTADPCVLL